MPPMLGTEHTTLTGSLIKHVSVDAWRNRARKRLIAQCDTSTLSSVHVFEIMGCGMLRMPGSVRYRW